MNPEPAASFVGDPPAAAETEVLADRRELALVAFERTRMPMVVADPRQPDTPVVLANHAFLELTGYTAEEVIGRNCRFLQGPDTDAGAIARLGAGLRADEDHVEVELLNYRKDGSTFWNQLSISAVRDGQGALLYYFGSQKDVTTRRQTQRLETAERLLLKEVDHRAMNALALVQSIVRLSKADDVRAYAAAILGRVDALARAHRMLASSSWRGADLRKILESEIASAPRHQVKTRGPDVLLGAHLVQPLTLALHEFTANAIRHGALSSRTGALEISWERRGDELSIAWNERATGEINPSPTRGFGLRIAEMMIQRQVGGALSTAWNAGGLTAQITVPLRRNEITAAPSAPDNARSQG